jgi:hypothetical protein
MTLPPVRLSLESERITLLRMCRLSRKPWSGAADAQAERGYEAGQTFETSIPLLHCATFYEVAQNDV